MIHAGVEDPITKNAPIHLSAEACVIKKSAGLISQLLPPNETVMLTLVLQAARLSSVTEVNVSGDKLDSRYS
jgi:hypothetical protein